MTFQRIVETTDKFNRDLLIDAGGFERHNTMNSARKVNSEQ